MNLITNASDALLGEPGLVTVRTGTVHADARLLAGTYLNEELPAGEYVYLEVTDSGVGMDTATRARIFEPFFTTKFTGRGLGLAAVLGIVRSHKGAIDVTSEPGCGTTFRVLFPASAAIAEVPLARNLMPAAWKGSGLALVVDDEEAVRGVARHVLERSGFSTVEAATGEEALAICSAQQKSLRIVLLDLTMPGMSGEATLGGAAAPVAVAFRDRIERLHARRQQRNRRRAVSRQAVPSLRARGHRPTPARSRSCSYVGPSFSLNRQARLLGPTSSVPPRKTPRPSRRPTDPARTLPACGRRDRGGFCASSISFGTDSSFGSWLMAKTALIRTS